MTDDRSERPASLSHAMVRAATPHEITEALNAMRTPIDPVAVPGMDSSQWLRVEQQGDVELHRHDTTVTPESVRTPQLGNQNPPTDLDIAVIAAAIRIAETARPCPATRYEAITAIAAVELRRIAYLVFDQGIKAPAPDEDEHHDVVDVQQAETVHGGGFCLMPGCYDEPPPGAHLCVEHTPASPPEPAPRNHDWRWHHHSDRSHAHWVDNPDHRHEPLDHGARRMRPDDDNSISETEQEQRITGWGPHTERCGIAGCGYTAYGTTPAEASANLVPHLDTDHNAPIAETERERRIYARGWHDALEWNATNPDRCEGRGRCVKPGCPNQDVSDQPLDEPAHRR